MPNSCIFVFPKKITPQLRNFETETASFLTDRTSCSHVLPPVTIASYFMFANTYKNVLQRRNVLNYLPLDGWGRQSISSLIAMKIPSSIDNGFPAQPTSRSALSINFGIFPPTVNTFIHDKKLYPNLQLLLIGKKTANSIICFKNLHNSHYLPQTFV